MTAAVNQSKIAELARRETADHITDELDCALLHRGEPTPAAVSGMLEAVRDFALAVEVPDVPPGQDPLDHPSSVGDCTFAQRDALELMVQGLAAYVRATGIADDAIDRYREEMRSA